MYTFRSFFYFSDAFWLGCGETESGDQSPRPEGVRAARGRGGTGTPGREAPEKGEKERTHTKESVHTERANVLKALSWCAEAQPGRNRLPPPTLRAPRRPVP